MSRGDFTHGANRSSDGLVGPPQRPTRTPSGVTDPSRAGRESGSEEASTLGAWPRPRGNEVELQVFPVKYAPGYHRPLDDPLQRGESSVRIWFGNSYGNARGEMTHGAIDIFGPIGSTIRLTSTQTVVDQWLYEGRAYSGVTSADDGTRGGNCVRTIDSLGYIHYYAHMRAPPELTPGANYPSGHVIGELGDTGAARGDGHLHYQVKQPHVLGSESRYTMPSLWSDVAAFSARGGQNVNTYEQLITLARRTMSPPALQIGSGRQYVLPAPGDDQTALTGRGRAWRSVDRSHHPNRRTHRNTEP